MQSVDDLLGTHVKLSQYSHLSYKIHYYTRNNNYFLLTHSEVLIWLYSFL